MKIDVLAIDVEHAEQARPDLTREALIAAAIERGISLAARPVEARVPDDIPAEERFQRLRTLFATTAALAAETRTRLILERDRFQRAATSELQAFIEYVELDRDIVPPLKLEARRLREVVRQLELEAVARDVDPATIEPQIDWPNTLAVDAYEAPRYVSNESRRRAAVAFFRRDGE